jgi:hypothetical protein
VSERDDRRDLVAGAGVSPADPGDAGGHPGDADDADAGDAADAGDIDVVQAVADLVGDLVEDDPPPVNDGRP